MQYFESKMYMLLRACKEEFVRKPILRDSNGKAIGHGSFWRREPFDYSDYERDLPHTDYDRIRTLDLTFADRQRQVAADNVSVHSTKRNHEKDSDWQFCTNVKMSTRDVTYFKLKEAKTKSRYGNISHHGNAWI